MRNRYRLLIILLVFFSLPLLSVNRVNSEVPPLLSVVKKVDKEIVSVGEPFYIYIEITNISNQTAYNVSLIDSYPEWSFEVLDHGALFWPIVEPNETVYSYFKLKVKNFISPKFSLGVSKVEYYDYRGVKYISSSDVVYLTLTYYSGEKVNTKDVWRNIAIGLSIVMFAVIIPLIVLEYRFYIGYKRETKT